MLPVWVDWVAWLFPKAGRGRAFGWSNSAAAASAVVAAAVAGVITALLGFPAGYAVLFFVGTAFYAFSMLTFIPVREPLDALPPPRLATREILARFWHSLSEKNFRHYLVSRVLLTAWTGPVAFLAVYYRSAQGGGLTEDTLISLGAAVAFAQMVAGLLFGRIGDRIGHKLGAVLGAIAQVAALVVVMFFKGEWACGLAFILVGVGYASGWVSHQNLTFELCPYDSRMIHITVCALAMAPFTALAPILAGPVIEHVGMARAALWFLVPTVLGLLWLLLFVREPRSLQADPPDRS